MDVFGEFSQATQTQKTTQGEGGGWRGLYRVIDLVYFTNQLLEGLLTLDHSNLPHPSSRHQPHRSLSLLTLGRSRALVVPH